MGFILILRAFAEVFGWYSRTELNRDPRFRKPLLYPFELREQSAYYQRIIDGFGRNYLII